MSEGGLGGSEARFLCSELGVFRSGRFSPHSARTRDESKVDPKNGSVQGSRIFWEGRIKPLRRGRGSRIEVPQLPHRQRHGRPRQPSPGLRRAPRHRECVLQQSLRAIHGSHHHGIVGGHLLHRPILGLEASGRIGGRSERPGFLEPPLTAPRQLVVVLELPSVILVDAEGRRLLGLHGLRRHRDRLVRPCIVGLRDILNMLRPPPAIPGHLARQILFEGRAGGLPGHLPCQATADQRARESQESTGGCAAGGVRRAGDGGHQCAPNHEGVVGPAARGRRRQSAEGRLRHRQRSGRASVAGKRAELRAPGAAEAHPPLQRHHLRFRAGPDPQGSGLALRRGLSPLHHEAPLHGVLQGHQQRTFERFVTCCKVH